MDKLFQRLQQQQRYVHGQLKQTFDAVNAINAIGTFRRSRQDRSIHQITDDAYHRQAQQLDRDIENLQWLSEACDQAMEIFEAAQQRVEQRIAGCGSRVSGSGGRQLAGCEVLDRPGQPATSLWSGGNE
jgi:hypothetical protein